MDCGVVGGEGDQVVPDISGDLKIACSRVLCSSLTAQKCVFQSEMKKTESLLLWLRQQSSEKAPLGDLTPVSIEIRGSAYCGACGKPRLAELSPNILASFLDLLRAYLKF